MAKKAKPLSVKLPKRVAGVKIPKAIRKGPLADFLNSSGGQVIFAEALLIAARAYAKRHVDPYSPVGEFLHDPMEKAREVAKEGRSEFAQDSTRLSHAFAQGMQAFRDALNDEGAQKDRDADAGPRDLAKKKRQAFRPQHDQGSPTPH